MLAVFAAIKHFLQMVEGREFSIYTDHRPLTYAFRQKLEKASPRQARQLDFISQFTTDLRYVAGAKNIPADALSRIEAISVTPTIDFTEITKEELIDKEI